MNDSDSGALKSLEKKVEILTRALEREKRAHGQAEQLLEEKSRSIYYSNTKLLTQTHLLTKRNREIEFFHSINEANKSDPSFERALQSFLHAVRELTGWTLGHAYIPKTQPPSLVSAKIWSIQGNRDFADFKEVTESTILFRGEGISGRAYAAAAPVIVETLNQEHVASGLESLIQMDLHSAMAVPAFSGSSIIAVFEFFAKKIDSKDTDIINTVCLGCVQLGNYFSKKEGELELHKEKLNFEKLVNGLNQSAIVSIAGENGLITYVNEAFCNISGYGRVELIGSNHNIVNSGNHPPEFFKEMWSKITKGETWRGDICNRKKNGELYWVDTSISQVISIGGGFEYMSIRYDITGRKETEAKLVQSSKLASLGEMAGGIAHEINTPLAIIQGKAKQQLRLIQLGKFSLEDGSRELSKIFDTSERIAKIVKGLRSFSRNAEGDPMAACEVNVIMGNILGLCSEKFKVNGVSLLVQDIPEAQLFCRSIQLEQVLVNLLNNAHDAVMGYSEKWVKISFSLTENNLSIFVTDSGLGIPPKVVARLMEPFFTTKEVGKGTGLGLSISKGIIEDHHGHLYYDSTSTNTRFVVELPRLEFFEKKTAA